MPKIRYLGDCRKKTVKVNEDCLIDLINRYQKAQKVKTLDLADKLGIAPDSVSRKKTRGSEAFTVGELLAWCRLLNVPAEAVAEAVTRQMEGKK